MADKGLKFCYYALGTDICSDSLVWVADDVVKNNQGENPMKKWFYTALALMAVGAFFTIGCGGSSSSSSGPTYGGNRNPVADMMTNGLDMAMAAAEGAQFAMSGGPDDFDALSRSATRILAALVKAEEYVGDCGGTMEVFIDPESDLITFLSGKIVFQDYCDITPNMDEMQTGGYTFNGSVSITLRSTETQDTQSFTYSSFTIVDGDDINFYNGTWNATHPAGEFLTIKMNMLMRFTDSATDLELWFPDWVVSEDCSAECQYNFTGTVYHSEFGSAQLSTPVPLVITDETPSGGVFELFATTDEKAQLALTPGSPCLDTFFELSIWDPGIPESGDWGSPLYYTEEWMPSCTD